MKLRTEHPLHTEIAQHESGWWLPAQVGGSFEKWQREAESHIDAALPFVKGANIAVQAGCHVGVWAHYLEVFFKYVYTFEADSVNWKCACLNLSMHPNCLLYKLALGAECGTLPWSRSLSNTGKHKIDVKGRGRGRAAGTVDVVTIDSLGLPACDLICLDIEGYEQMALKGGTATIERFRPVVLIEDLPHAPWHGLPLGGAQRWLEARGYRLAGRVDEDQIWVPG